MDGFAQFERVGALFAEDFDRPEAVLDPEVIEPVFSAAELTAAREAAWRDGHEAGLKEAAQGNAAALQLSVRTIGEQFAVECAAAHAHAEAAAGAIARLLLDSLAAAFPTLCAQHGNAEVRSLVRVVLPALTQEPTVTLRAHPQTAEAARLEIAQVEPDLVAHLQVVVCETMPPGDIRIIWRNGTAARDAALLWQEVAAVLVPFGLLRPETTIQEVTDGN